MRRTLFLVAALGATAAVSTAQAEAPYGAASTSADVVDEQLVAPASDEAGDDDDEDEAPPTGSTMRRPGGAVADDDAPASSDGQSGASSSTDPAASGGASAQPWRQITEAELSRPSENYPYVEWHGYYRFRIDNFWNLDLATDGTSSVLPPIESLVGADTRAGGTWADIPDSVTLNDGTVLNLRDYQKEGANYIASANMRFRLRPIFHLSQAASLHLEMDILDNLVMGSSPYTVDAPFQFFSQGQRPTNPADAARQAVRINQAYGQVSAFFGTLRVGRMANDWGLGMMFNGGGSYSALRERRVSSRGLAMAGHGCIDCDYGDYVDRASIETELFGHHIMLAYDYTLSGATTPDDGFGQPRDLGQYDDARSFVVSIARRPQTPEEIGARNRTLRELNRPAFDYGAYFMFRNQRLDGSQCLDPLDPATCSFTPRGASMFVPDLWFRLEYEPSDRRRIRLEGEFAAMLGTVEYAAGSVAELGTGDFERRIQQFAAALEFEYINFGFASGFNAGFATGRSGDATNPGFGANDGINPLNDRRLSAFHFDRNYFVDMIMFREIIGTVTNAAYINPFFQYDLFAKQNDSLGIRLDLITAMAMNREMTPSGQGFYGVEGNIMAFYRQPRYGVDLQVGLFLPGNAFNAVAGRPRFGGIEQYLGQAAGSTYVDGEGRTAKPATTLQTRFYWAF